MGSYQIRDGDHDDGYCGDPIHDPNDFHIVRDDHDDYDYHGGDGAAHSFCVQTA
jgi:hypothetical protein